MKTASLTLFVLTAITQALAAATDTDRTLACASPRTAVPLLQGYNGNVGDHFYTTDQNEMDNAIKNLGYTAEGTTAYVFPGTTGSDGTTPFHRTYSPYYKDHYYTPVGTELTAAIHQWDYAYEGIPGYIYQNVNCGGVPLYHLWDGKHVDHFYTASLSERDSKIKDSGYTDLGISGYVLPV